MRKVTARTLVAMALTSTLAGCGFNFGGSDKPATTTTSSTIPQATYVFPPVVSEAPFDTQQAIAISMTLNDLPEGWTAQPPVPSRVPRDAVVDEVFVQCLFGENQSTLSAYVVSSVYASPDKRTVVRTFTRAVRDAATGSADFSVFKADRVSKCQTTMYDRERNPPEGVTSVGRKYGETPPSVLPVDVLSAPDGSTDVLSYRMIITPPDFTPTHQDVFGYGAGRYEVVLLVQSSDVPSGTVEAGILNNVKQRVQNAARAG